MLELWNTIKILGVSFIFFYLLLFMPVALVVASESLPRWQWSRRTTIHTAQIAAGLTICVAIMMEI